MRSFALLSLPQVAEILGVSRQRVYQLDDDLHPSLVPRGQKMVERWYDPEVVERARVARQHTEVETARPHKIAAAIASQRLLEYAQSAPFFLGVAPEATEDVREELRAIAARIAK